MTGLNLNWLLSEALMRYGIQNVHSCINMVLSVYGLRFSRL
jgi:hypothetical protein